MMIGITGTPGTGKTSVARELERRGHIVVWIKDTIRDYVLAEDRDRDTLVVDVERWAEEFPPIDGIVEGHLAHFLPCDRIVVLRCRPDVLQQRLLPRGYAPEKIAENTEAEALDVVLVETLEERPEDTILELDTTEQTAPECADRIEQFMRGKLPSSYGHIDWTDYLVLD
ncbi:adenylate kinase [Methanoculleus sp. FWC-SCC1]|uniref:Putative adenylate kinase n=1 Tax=Methanoculleus frigidifontis TaxID=2584085 RepID=A0ABT8MCB2_9EURY|nr:adenylate kinase family protein [Methanoculleus sp. FWC-SCC1]MDN7025575.1 adenylate kinase [Methanoculleus sp. FWC-SCC1]